MKINSLADLKPLENTQFWLLATSASLTAVYASVYLRLDGNSSQVAVSLLGLGAVFSLLAEKRQTLKFESDIFSSLLGILLIGFVLLRSNYVGAVDSFVELTPFIAFFGLALLASGIKGLRQYWLELLIIFAFNLPVAYISQHLDISIFTAKFSSAFLAYLGLPVVRQGVNIIMPTGAVEVYPGCSGMETISQLVKLALLFLIMFPTHSLFKKILVPLVATIIAFLINAVRVALMAYLVAKSTPESFDYWHTGTGSQIFFLACTLLFGGFCYLITKQDDDSDRNEQLELPS
ncbi:cyanoexosortase A [Synechocystis sp. PCC 7509]|uniref:cyanoexosortase A n=1 Tax=Synechocystis sp. PCC 7509 TaxID=927677 RepID=UPI0002AC13C3|nr:cyanoexosortase A [Synechocystis sp. PCC 7509]